MDELRKYTGTKNLEIAGKRKNTSNDIVTLYWNDNGRDDGEIIASINNLYCHTGFIELDDLYNESDYLPMLIGTKFYPSFYR